MKTFFMGMLAAVMMLTGAAFAADEENQTHSKSTATLKAEELKPAAAAIPETQKHVAKPAKPRGKSNQPRAKNLDFRHCLELEDNAAIAKCAQE